MATKQYRNNFKDMRPDVAKHMLGVKFLTQP